MSAIAGKFSCATCGKTFTWKPELAGKRAKCKCGKPITVPAKSPGNEVGEDDLYALSDFAATEKIAVASAEPVIVDPVQAPPVAKKARLANAVGNATGNAAVNPLAYQRPIPRGRELAATSATLLDPKRDLYVPLVLLCVGALLYISYYAVHYNLGFAGMMSTSIGLTIVTVFETALLIGFAFILAGPLGVSFGGVGTAILKLAATAVLCDGITTWVDGIISKYSGGLGGGSILGFGAVGLPVALGVYWGCFIYMFSMDPGDSWFVVVILSIFYRIMRVVLLLLLLKFILSFSGVNGSAVSLPSIGGQPPAAANPIDAEVEDARLRHALLEGRKCAADYSLGVESVPVNAWYDAGVKHVWFETERNVDGKQIPSAMIVELPKDPTIRAKCYDIARAYYNGMKMDFEANAMKDTGENYIICPMPSK
jgi:hypothetical protein